jgi:hypothetical protein
VPNIEVELMPYSVCSLVYPQIASTDLDGLICKIMLY